MKKSKIIYFILAILLGIFMFVYSEFDDSPGGQLLGLLSIIIGIVGVVKRRKLVISWQRLISKGSTCPRCGSTENELDKAVLQLKEKLNPLRIDVILEKTELSLEEFKKDPIQSNKILFNGKPLENLIGAETGQSQCCDVCGDKECRTVETKKESHETIPADMIVRAGLAAVRVKTQN